MPGPYKTEADRQVEREWRDRVEDILTEEGYTVHREPTVHDTLWVNGLPDGSSMVISFERAD